MTKSREKGRNELTDEALREATRTGKDVCAILRSMLQTAKRSRDRAKQKKVERAQKFLGCRNRRKRRRG
jgi:hypothetical protein